MPGHSAIRQEPVTPLLTITLAVYNGEPYLRGFFDSILSQTFQDFELIISDNVSTDGTKRILEEYSKKDPRIKVFTQPRHVNSRDNYDYLLRFTGKKYFMWTACDDRYSPDFIETIIARMEEDESISLAYCPYQKVDEEGNQLGSPVCVDISGKNAWGRLFKFYRNYDDAIIYGIYRSSDIEGQVLPEWWSKNKDNPYDIAYGFLPYVIAKGNYCLVGKKPLFFKFMKISGHYQPFKKQKRVLEYFLFLLLLKINLSWVQFINIQKGSSMMIALGCLPIICFRNFLDILKIFRNIIFKRMKYAFR